MSKKYEISKEKLSLNQVQNNIVVDLKRVTILTIAIISLFITPLPSATAKETEQIPYLSQYVKQRALENDVYDLIVKVLYEKDYIVGKIDGSIQEKDLTIWIAGSNKNIKHIKDDAERTIYSALEEKKYGSFHIKIKQYTQEKYKGHRIPKLNVRDKQYMKASQELEKKITEQLKNHHYDTAYPIQVRINSKEKFMYVAVPNTEKRMKELKNLLRATSKEYGKFKMRVTRIDMKAREQEIRWEKNFIVSTIGNGLMANKDFKVKTYSYSFHPYPLQLDIQTSIKSTDANAKVLAGKMEKEIKDFIKLDETTKEIRNDPYVLTVYSEDKKKIN